MWIRDDLRHTVFAMLILGLPLVGCDSPNDLGHRIFGYVDTQGKVVIAPVFLEARPFHEGLAAAAVASGWGFVDRRGHWVVQPEYLASGDFSEGLAAVRETSGLWGYIDRMGRTIIPPAFESACPFLAGHAYVLMPDDHPVTIDHQGRPAAGDADPLQVVACLATEDADRKIVALLDSDYLAQAHLADQGLLPARSQSSVDGAMGFVDLDGRWVIDPVYSNVAAFVDGLALVERDGKTGFIDRTGRVVVPLRFDEALLRFSRGRTIAIEAEHAWLIDTQGDHVADLGPWPWPKAVRNDDFGWLTWFVGHRDFFADGPVPWQQGGKWGYVGRNGAWVVEPKYDSAQMFHRGRATVQDQGQGLLIDTTGTVVAQSAAGWIGPSDGTLVRAGTASRWGFVDERSEEPPSIPFATARLTFAQSTFVDSRPLKFDEGLAVVSSFARHRWSILDHRGKTLATIKSEWIEEAGPGHYAFVDDQRWGLLDRSLGVVAQSRFDGERKPRFWNDSPYAEVLLDGRKGCIDRQGRSVLQPGILEIVDCMPPVIRAKGAEGVGAVDLDGKWLVSPKYDELVRLGEDSGDVYFKAVKGGTAQLVHVTGGRVRYSEPGELKSCDAFRSCFVRGGDKLRRLDPDSLLPVGPPFDEARSSGSSEACSPVRQGGRWGCLSGAGQLVLPVEYEQIKRSGAVYLIQREQRWGVANPQGKLLLSPRYDEVKPAGDGSHAVRVGEKWGFVRDGDVETMTPRFDRFVAARAGLTMMVLEGRTTLSTASGDSIADPSDDWVQHIYSLADFSKSMWAALTTDRRLHFIDKRTLEVHELQAPEGFRWSLPGNSDEWAAGSFRDAGFSSILAIVPADSAGLNYVTPREVLLDPQGRRVVTPLLESILPDYALSCSGAFQVGLGGKCGFIDEEGRSLVPMRYDHCSCDDDGQFLVGEEDTVESNPDSAGPESTSRRD